MEEKKISINLHVPYDNVIFKGKPAYLCKNGVLFTDEEFRNKYEGKPEELKKEYDRRSIKGPVYTIKKGELVESFPDATIPHFLCREEPDGPFIAPKNMELPFSSKPATKENKRKLGMSMSAKEREKLISEWKYTPEDGVTVIKKNLTTGKQPKIIILLSLALMAVSLGSMYISTVHTATYLFDYVDMVSAWIMSTVITLYSSTAFEVVILFHDNKRHILSVIFAFLWSLVTLFSMITTVSIFYDKYNFTAMENAEINSEAEGSRFALEILQKQEASLKEAIEFKKEEIEYRRSMDYATHQRTLELDDLQKQLQDNLQKQQELLLETPEASKEEHEIKKKEGLFAFLGRIMGLNEGILEFIMSTLSAVFINLISPLSVTVVVSFLGGMKKKE